MTDVLSKEQRTKNMKAIGPVSKLEDKVCKELWKRGARFRRNVKSLYGKPDIAIKKYKIVIFIDSCFWHGCKIHGKIPKTNREFWVEKLERNIQRDKEVSDYYIRKGWNILRVWEHEIKEDFNGSINKISDFINQAKN
ncbi:very short patch repair endonuclease [Thermoactinomyces intermedius]|jgi:DNA mismatch endonuclease, patch repair protein|uniref:Very short patch repair endonuclease n=1 Tax=Thermoactinomyces intermedius TaxID=2024 RepID=A0A8I1AB86_THEIN|nr:very short patch repair endonuclease [Thermoactinomyces intermedius]MBA4548789.1 very short patch repair endonuclease [Thermoactinomyces intermedius]MBA4837139.1 very short patch repair endonuclease [Thermoactinomyces intermedius]MBH8594667.1 very short patch repair endonuclease [Thermoactinomyces intermedius]